MITDTQWDKIAKATPTEESPLGKAEAFLSYLAGMHLHSEALSREQVSVEIPAAFARVARAVLLSKEMDKSPIDIAKVEAKLRQKLAPATLPPAFSSVDEEEMEEKPMKSSARTPVQPDSLPPLAFEGGSVVEDVAVVARAKNLELGCRVAALRAVRGILKGSKGTLLALGKEAKVVWDDGALTDVKGEGSRERTIPLASIEVLDTKEARAPKPGKPEASAVQDLPAGEPWSKITPFMGAMVFETCGCCHASDLCTPLSRS